MAHATTTAVDISEMCRAGPVRRRHALGPRSGMRTTIKRHHVLVLRFIVSHTTRGIEGRRDSALQHFVGQAPELLRELRPKPKALFSLRPAGCRRDAIELVEKRTSERGLLSKTPQRLRQIDLTKSHERPKHGGRASRASPVRQASRGPPLGIPSTGTSRAKVRQFREDRPIGQEKNTVQVAVDDL